MFHNKVFILCNIISQLCYCGNEYQGVCVWIIHPCIPQTLLFFHICGSPPLYVAKSLVLYLARSSSPPILSGELQIFGRHPICWCCVVIAFCWCKKKDKNWFLAALRTIPLFSSSYMKCSCLKRTYQLYCCFLAVYGSFFMHFYRLSVFSFLCLLF